MQGFDLDPDIIYLNHAAVAPWPTATRDAVIAFAEENARLGARHYPQWTQREIGLREKLRQLINAPSIDDIALLKSTSEGLSFIAYGLPWERGDNIVIPASEFPSNRVVWESLNQYGVDVRLVEINDCEQPELRLIEAMDENTRLLSCSSVQYSTGLRLDLEQLGLACRKHGILFCVDAIQSLGARHFDVVAAKADFVVADGHKWMLGPEGLALFYCSAAMRNSLKLHEYGWHMLKHPGDFSCSDWESIDTAQRFECGSPNTLGVVALDASLEVLFSAGMEHVENTVLSHSAHLLEELGKIQGIELLTPLDDARHAGIVTFRHQSLALCVLPAAAAYGYHRIFIPLSNSWNRFCAGSMILSVPDGRLILNHRYGQMSHKWLHSIYK
jgi:selenocysteine lyase/cysteine desulfurase